MSFARTSWSALLSALIAASALGEGGGPLIVPDDRAVDLSVDPAPVESATLPPPPPRAEPAPSRERQPLGDPPAAATTGTAPNESSAFNPLHTLDPRRSEFARVGVALAVVVGLMLLLRWGARRMAGPMAGGGRPSGVLEVLGRYPIARGQQLVLLKMAGRVVLLHQSRTAMTSLTEVSDPDEVAALLARVEAVTRASGGRRFQSLLQAMGRPAADAETFPPTAGREPGRTETVVVDLTRRSRRRSLPRGGAAV